MIGAQAVVHSKLQQSLEMLDVFRVAAVADAFLRWWSPVLPYLDGTARHGHTVSGRQALNVTKRGRSSVIVQPEQQEVGDGGIVEFAGNLRMGPHAIEGVAEQKEIF